MEGAINLYQMEIVLKSRPKAANRHRLSRACVTKGTKRNFN
jgi:hypothetical protein